MLQGRKSHSCGISAIFFSVLYDWHKSINNSFQFRVFLSGIISWKGASFFNDEFVFQMGGIDFDWGLKKIAGWGMPPPPTPPSPSTHPLWETWSVFSFKLFEFFFKMNFWNIWINEPIKLVANPQVIQPNQIQVIKAISVPSFRGVFRAQLKILAFVHCITKEKLHCRCSTGSSILTPLKLSIKTAEQHQLHRSCAFIVDQILYVGFHAYLTFFTNSYFHCFEQVKAIWEGFQKLKK